MIAKRFIAWAALLGAIGVALGAMGAHFLKPKLSVESLMAFETGVRYLLYHVFALIAVSLLHEKLDNKLLGLAGKLFIAGVILFSGSLFILSTKSLMGFDETQLRWLGAITPFGGLSFITGWLLLFRASFKK